MPSVVLLGTGNVATHLFYAFQKAKTVEIVQVYGRKKPGLNYFEALTKVTNDTSQILDADIYILAISDSSVAQMSQSLKHKKGLVVHTSGSVSLDTILSKRRGVFYPLQTFTKGREADFSKVPICIEAENAEDFTLLKTLGTAISGKVHQISTQQRKKLHLSAVLVNNFTNHLFHIAQEICKENDIPFHLLQPLISETVNKIRHLAPIDAQTGPARRNDMETMQLHLEQFKNPLQKKIYLRLSESIKKTYEKEL
ncbi:MAG: DUF2520 domain-containing protein [Bacteroidota bacterium]